MNPNTLAADIQSRQTQKQTREQIYMALLTEGHLVVEIEAAYAELKQAGHKAELQKKTIRTILTIGAILIGLGIFSFIAANWDGMGKVMKVFLIMASTVCANVAGYGLYAHSEYKKTGEALLLLGSILFGAGIFLVAQIFNIRANWPNGFILWMIGTLGMAFATEAKALFALAVPVGLVAAGGYPIDIIPELFGGRHGKAIVSSGVLLFFATILTFAAGFMIQHKKVQLDS